MELEIHCKACFQRLECDWGVGAHGVVWVSVEPCSDCEKKTAEASESKGYDKGYEDGLREGQDKAWITLGKAMVRP